MAAEITEHHEGEVISSIDDHDVHLLRLVIPPKDECTPSYITWCNTRISGSDVIFYDHEELSDKAPCLTCFRE
jgi:hypothetical protein